VVREREKGRGGWGRRQHIVAQNKKKIMVVVVAVAVGTVVVDIISHHRNETKQLKSVSRH
jgi:hypothetical protein